MLDGCKQFGEILSKLQDISNKVKKCMLNTYTKLNNKKLSQII